MPPGTVFDAGMRHSRPKPFTIEALARYLAKDALKRTIIVITRLERRLFSLAVLVPVPFAVAAKTDDILGKPSNDTVVASDISSLGTLFDFEAWRSRGKQIRQGTRDECFGNLSIALSQVGPVLSSETAGAAGALSLLPTAGALIGAPANELWVLYKLMPVAGVLSMMLSLGGNIVPTKSSEYEVNAEKFSYGGYVASSKEDEDGNETFEEGPEDHSVGNSAQTFAARVERRSRKNVMGRRGARIALGISLQLFWLGILLFACYLTAAGGVVSWACKAWFWMYFWYICVVLSSFLENVAGVPFTQQWTLRVSRAPRLRISPDAPVLVAVDELREIRVESGTRRSKSPDGQREAASRGNDEIELCEFNVERERGRSTSTYKRPFIEQCERGESFRPIRRTRSELLSNLEAGYNTVGRIVLDREEPWAASRIPFYVIVSLEGVSASHAVLRVVSKAVTVGVFAAGTAAFASATMVTISIALTVLCLVLGAGVFGRVVSMWMASEMMATDPVLHAVVKTRSEAAEHISNILAIDGLCVEIMGHVVVNGRCIGRYNPWFSAASFLGVLASAFDISSLAQKN